MKCPNCGYETPYTSVDDGKRYRSAVETRLTQYGYPEHMTPQKHQAATAIRKVIAIRYGITGKAGGSMLPELADKAITALDEILPKKAGKNCSTCHYGYVDELADLTCVNGASEFCTEYVDNYDWCEEWEAKP